MLMVEFQNSKKICPYGSQNTVRMTLPADGWDLNFFQAFTLNALQLQLHVTIIPQNASLSIERLFNSWQIWSSVSLWLPVGRPGTRLAQAVLYRSLFWIALCLNSNTYANSPTVRRLMSRNNWSIRERMLHFDQSSTFFINVRVVKQFVLYNFNILSCISLAMIPAIENLITARLYSVVQCLGGFAISL